MEEKKYFDSLVLEIERALNLGRFVPYSGAWGFIRDLEEVKQKIDNLASSSKDKELDILNECIISASHEQLEAITHSTTQKVAEVLMEKYPLSAAKIYRALGIRRLKSKKSKYYEIALEHFQKSMKLYHKAGCEKEWLSLVENIRKEHSRKYSFISDFEKSNGSIRFWGK